MISSHSEDMCPALEKLNGAGSDALSVTEELEHTGLRPARFDVLILCIAEFITIHYQMRSLMFTRILCYKNPRSIE